MLPTFLSGRRRSFVSYASGSQCPLNPGPRERIPIWRLLISPTRNTKPARGFQLFYRALNRSRWHAEPLRDPLLGRPCGFGRAVQVISDDVCNPERRGIHSAVAADSVQPAHLLGRDGLPRDHWAGLPLSFVTNVSIASAGMRVHRPIFTISSCFCRINS